MRMPPRPTATSFCKKAPGGGGRLNWTSMPAMLANFFAHEAGSNSQRIQTTIPGGDMYNEYNLKSAEMRKQLHQCANAFSGVSNLSSEVRSQTIRPTSFPKRMAVQVGTMLKIDLSGTKAAIEAIAGNSLEEISIQPSWTDSSDESNEWEALSISHSRDRVSLNKSEPSDKYEIQLSKLLELKVHIPARWCSLDFRTSEGRVYVQNVREGSLRVTTAGGDVKLGDVKGGEAFIETHGGEFQAKVLQAGSCVSTEGGKLYVDKLQGDAIKLDSGGGNMAIGTLYGNDVTVESSGGSVEAMRIHAQQMAHISSNGGPITVRGFDGNGVFLSKGGRIELQLSEHAEEVFVDATHGDVVLSLPSNLKAKLTYEGKRGPIQDGNILKPGGESNVYLYSDSQSSSRSLGQDMGWRGSENDIRSADDEGVSCKIVVCTVGKLFVMQKGWLDRI